MAKIRPAGHSDIPALIALGRQMHAESPRFARVKFDADKLCTQLVTMIESVWCMILVAEEEGQIVGTIGGGVTPYYFSNELHGYEHWVYVALSHRGSSVGARLVKEWDNLLVSEGIKESVLGISTEVDSERTKQFYERLGYRLAGYIMVKSNVRL